MPMTAARSTRHLFSLTLAVALLQGCGGGGGDSDPGNGGTPPPPPPPPSAQGRLWHDNFALDSRDGTQIASLSGAAPTQVTPKLPAWPWADGSQYVTADATSSSGSTVVTVSEAGSGNTLYQMSVDGYLRGVKPSPVNKHVILGLWSTDSVSPASYVFYDVAAHTVLDSLDADGVAVNWLPDGRYIAVSNAGQIALGTVGGNVQSAGAVSVPAGRAVNNIWVNPQGTQMLLQMWSKLPSGSVDQTDLWVSGIDGSGVGQLTNTHITSYGKWSPDGKRVAFDVDTGVTCGTASCSGSCQIFYADASARNVSALLSAGDAAQFHVKNSQGADRVLGCELLAWTQ